jgi:hypothetical protein
MVVKIAETATDLRVRRSASRCVQVKVAEGLKESELKPADELILLRAITRLAPHDRLLSRDVKRVRESRTKILVPPLLLLSSKATSLPKTTVKSVGGFELPGVGGWLRAIGGAFGFQAVSCHDQNQITFARGSWANERQWVQWDDPSPELQNTFLMAPYMSSTVLSRPFAEKLRLQTMASHDAFAQTSFEVGSPLWLPKDAIQASSHQLTLWVIRVVGPRVILGSYESGREVRSHDVTDVLTSAGASGKGTRLCLEASAVPGQIALAFGHHVLLLAEQGTVKVQDLGARVLELLPVRGRLTGWVALLERGAVLISPGLQKTTVLDDSLEMPRGAFLSNERLLLVSQLEGKVLQMRPEQTQVASWFPFSGEQGFALTATNRPEEFAIFHPKGNVSLWRFA